MVNVEWNLDKAKKVWLEEGIEKGIEKGRMETAIEMLREKFPQEKIAKFTKLSVEKINEIGRLNGLL